MFGQQGKVVVCVACICFLSLSQLDFDSESHVDNDVIISNDVLKEHNSSTLPSISSINSIVTDVDTNPSVTTGSQTTSRSPNLATLSGRSKLFEREGVIVTAASENHLCALVQLLTSLNQSAPSTPVIVYDLNFEEPFFEITKLQRVHPNVVSVRRFKYFQFPPWFRIDKEAGHWAWKPMIIKEVVDEFETTVLWLDSGAVMLKGRKISTLFSQIKRDGFFSSPSRGSIFMFIHIGMFAHYGEAKCCNKIDANSMRRACCCCGETNPTFTRGCLQCSPDLTPSKMDFWRETTMCNGAIIGFDFHHPLYYSKLLVPWVECANNISCIAPTFFGQRSTRTNHRQDQAALTFLSAQLGYQCHTGSISAGFALHKDEPKAGLEGWLTDLMQNGKSSCIQLFGNRSSLKHQHV